MYGVVEYFSIVQMIIRKVSLYAVLEGQAGHSGNSRIEGSAKSSSVEKIQARVDFAVRNFWANFNKRQSHSQPADSEHSRRAHRRNLLNLLFKTMAAVSQISKKRKV